jgi:hypothetical protein
MTSQLDAMLADSGVTPEESGELVRVLAPLQETATEVPSPSDQLLALFGEAPTAYDGPRTVRPVDRPRRTLAGALVLAVSCVGATGLSAAANTLPAPWQHGVSDFSRHYLPFDFPEPPHRSQPQHRTPSRFHVVTPRLDDSASRSVEARDPIPSVHPWVEVYAALAAPSTHGPSRGTHQTTAQGLPSPTPHAPPPGTVPGPGTDAPSSAEDDSPPGRDPHALSGGPGTTQPGRPSKPGHDGDHSEGPKKGDNKGGGPKNGGPKTGGPKNGGPKDERPDDPGRPGQGDGAGRPDEGGHGAGDPGAGSDGPAAQGPSDEGPRTTGQDAGPDKDKDPGHDDGPGNDQPATDGSGVLSRVVDAVLPT